MKIRIKGNSLRYRLTRSDISQLIDKHYLEERTSFVGGTLIYAVAITEGADLTAEYLDNMILLRLPKSLLESLEHPDTIGFSDEKGPVALLIEKDFTCLDKVEEDQSDNYPNPALFK